MANLNEPDIRAEEVYFQAWHSHDARQVTEKCISDLTYRREGKSTIVGTNGLEEYWAKNKKRQRDLSLNWLCIAQGDSWGVYIFTSNFFDSQEKNQQLVFGQIIFQLDESGKIYEIYEKYEKKNDFELPQLKKSWANYFSRLKSMLHPVRRYRAITNIIKILFRMAIALLAIAALIYVVSLISAPAAPVLPWKSGEETLLWGGIRDALGTSIAFSAIILFFFQIIYKKLSVGNAMRLHPITDLNSVSNILSTYANGASRAVVFIADGRHISNDPELIDRLKNIDTKNSLTIISDRSRRELFSAVQSDKLLNDLLVRLESKGKLHFGSRYLKTELAYIESDGISVALDMTTTKITALFGAERNKTLLNFIKELTDELYSPKTKPSPRANESRSRIVILCGKPSSGKSSLGEKLRDFGYVIINPANYNLDEIFPEASKPSSDMVEFLKDETNAEIFCEHIMDVLFQAPKVVIDSLETPALVKVLRRQIPQKGTLVYLDACDDVITERLLAQDLTKTKAKELLKKYELNSLESVKKQADLIVSGEASEEYIFQKMKEYLGV